MASAEGADGPGDLEGDYAGQPDTRSAEAALRARLSRKRTKTGCLTCRKRRIKCDETRPICRNCVKSKRLCDGYNQRVVFKQPNFDFRPGTNGAHITFPTGPGPSHPDPWQHEQAPGDPSTVFHHYAMEQPYHPMQHMHHIPMDQAYHPHPQPQAYPHQPAPPIPLPQVPFDPSAQQQPLHPPQMYQFGSSAAPMQGQPSHQFYTNGGPQPWNFRSQAEQAQHYAQTLPPGPQQSTAHPELPSPAEVKQEHQWINVSPVTDQSQTQVSPTSSRSSRTYTLPYTTTIENSNATAWSTNGYVPRPELSQPLDYRPPQLTTTSQYEAHTMAQSSPMDFTLPVYHRQEPQQDLFEIPSNFLQNAAVERVDDDYYDVQSDEEGDTSAMVPRYQIPYRSFSQIVAANNIVVHDPRRRRYDTFIHPGILDHYKPDEVANPLGNEATARLFLHFIAVTGPSLSIYERQVRNTSMLFTEGQIPFSQQGLWTYTMPLAALRNTGLLHAMLALASLHVAKLTNASTTPSYLHYAWALKRVHNSVGDEKKRFKLTTMAASMLLGFYEIMTAEHTKWNAHLAGSKQLFLDTDFCTMTKQFTQMKRGRAKRAPRKRRLSTEAQVQDDVLDQVHDVEEKVVSELSGREIKYDSHGQILTPNNTVPQELDIGKFEILRDLYWWYLKQDAYQSIISGNPLMLHYDRWTDCPPRAPLGRSDAVYGSFDHLILLLGRIANFAARDRKRKLRVMEANGGQWKPPSGMKMPRPPQASSQAAPPTPQTTTSTIPPNGGFMPVPMPPGGPAAGPPMFYGMAPAPKLNVQMPASYRNGMPTPEALSPQDPIDLHQATQNASEEYGRIRAALHSFASKLGDAFKPLTADHQPPLETPFGPALFYRSYDIGCLWAVYYMAMIVAIRSAPHMHPAAHVAAGIAAEETRFFAKEIGRIAAGIVPGPPDQPLNPALGAALSESCMPSFFAAIQYQDSAQRYHTVTRIKSIAERTGWGSTELIANGCETAWVKAAEAGRGPPYTRIARTKRSNDPRVNGSWETLDPNASPDAEDQQDRRLVPTNSNARLTWAIGIMGTEDDERAA